MKRFFLTVAALLSFAGAIAGSPYRVKTSGGATVGVEVCASNIFRIKVFTGSSASENLMDRYGLLNTPVESVDQRVDSRDPSVWKVSTPTHTLSVRLSDGMVSLETNEGAPVVKEVKFVPSGSPLVAALASDINAKFASLHVVKNDGIIGDDSNKNSKDRNESGDLSSSSVISIGLEPGERFYGGGSTSREHVQHRGELLRMHTTYQHTEIPMPFMMSSRGWGVFNCTTRKNFFDVGRHDPDRLNIYNTFGEADYFLMAGSSMKDVLDLYTSVTGRNHVMARWAYGLCFGPNMREDQWEVMRDAAGFRQAGVPCDVFWLEPQWMEKRYDFSTSKKWNYQMFSPEPYWVQDKYPKQLYNRLFIGKLRNMGFHLGLWLCEEYDLSITEEDAIAAREGRQLSGQEHWMDHLKTFLDYGVEGFKLDPARTIDEHPSAVYYNGYTDKEMHNLNQVLLQKQMNLMTREHLGRRVWYHYTAGWAGTQHWGASTSGDNGGGKTALFDQLNLGNSGYMNLSCDVMSVPKELEMQGLHFGIFLPWIQINSWFSLMQPFYYGEPEQSIYRDYIKLRYALMPYIYSAALEGYLKGMPIVRSMPLMFPDDRNCDDMCYQYMFGDNLCVGIFSNEIYLPEGTWTDAWTLEKVESRGETVTRAWPEGRAGLLFVRDGAIIPTIPEVQSIGVEPFRKLIVKVYPSDSSQYTLYEDDGDSYGYESGRIASTLMECTKSGKTVTFTVNPVEGSYEGMPSERDYTVAFHLACKPSKVWVDGAVVKDWRWDGVDGVLEVDAQHAKTAAKTVVKVQLSSKAVPAKGPVGSVDGSRSDAAASSNGVLY